MANQPNAYVAGCGVSDESYSGYGHEYSITTTVTSPSGRSATGYGGGTDYGRADVTIPLRNIDGSFDAGDFFVESTHEAFCPIRGMELSPNFTNFPLLVGISATCLIKTSPLSYVKIADCFGIMCPTDGYITQDDRGPQIIALRPFVYNVCSPVNLVAFVTPANCKCADYTQVFNIPGL